MTSAIRRAVVKSAVPIVRVRTARITPRKPHAHKCRRCAMRYEDACATPLVNGQCDCAIPGYTYPVWRTDRLPQSCCRLYAQPITDLAVLDLYALGGDQQWFFCPKCARTHPSDPKE